MRISDWSSDVCSSDLELIEVGLLQRRNLDRHDIAAEVFGDQLVLQQFLLHAIRIGAGLIDFVDGDDDRHLSGLGVIDRLDRLLLDRSEEHTSELQSLMRISYAVFCLKKKK